MAQTLARIFVHVVVSTTDRAPLVPRPFRAGLWILPTQGLASLRPGYNPHGASRLVLTTVKSRLLEMSLWNKVSAGRLGRRLATARGRREVRRRPGEASGTEAAGGHAGASPQAANAGSRSQPENRKLSAVSAGFRRNRKLSPVSGFPPVSPGSRCPDAYEPASHAAVSSNAWPNLSTSNSISSGEMTSGGENATVSPGNGRSIAPCSCARPTT